MANFDPGDEQYLDSGADMHPASATFDASPTDEDQADQQTTLAQREPEAHTPSLSPYTPSAPQQDTQSVSSLHPATAGDAGQIDFQRIRNDINALHPATKTATGYDANLNPITVQQKDAVKPGQPAPIKPFVDPPGADVPTINSGRLAHYQTEGIQYYKDPASGILVPKLNQDGTVAFKKQTSDVQYDENGKPVQIAQDEHGNRTAINPDADAPIGPHPDRPGEIYRQNKLSAWDYLGKASDLANSTDPAHQQAVEKSQELTDKALYFGKNAAATQGFQIARGKIDKQENDAITAFQQATKQKTDLETQIAAIKAKPEFTQTAGGVPVPLWGQVGAHLSDTAKALQDQVAQLQSQSSAITIPSDPLAKDPNNPGAKNEFALARETLSRLHGAFSASAMTDGGDTAAKDYHDALIADGRDPTTDPVLHAITQKREQLGLQDHPDGPQATASQQPTGDPGLDAQLNARRVQKFADDHQAKQDADAVKANPDLAPIIAERNAIQSEMRSAETPEEQQAAQAKADDWQKRTNAQIEAKNAAIHDAIATHKAVYADGITPPKSAPGFAQNEPLISGAGGKIVDESKLTPEKNEPLPIDWGKVQGNYAVTDSGGLRFKDGNFLRGLKEAMSDGLMTQADAKKNAPIFAKADQQAQQMQDLVKQAGGWQQVKAAIHGGGAGAAFLATAPIGAGLGAEAGAATGPYAPVAVPVLATVGSLATGYAGSKAYRALMDKMGEYNETVASINASATLHPVIDAAGEMAAFASGLPQVAMKGVGSLVGQVADALASKSAVIGETADDIRAALNAQKLAKGGQLNLTTMQGGKMVNAITPDIYSKASRYVDAIGKSYGSSGGGLRLGISNLSEQAEIQAERGATSGQIAATIAKEAVLRAGTMVAIDTALKEGSKAIGLGDGHQTWGGATYAAALGLFTVGHGAEFRNYDPKYTGDIIFRGAAHDIAQVPHDQELTPHDVENIAMFNNVDSKDVSQRITKPLTPEEQEVYQAFKDAVKSGKISADAGSTAVTAKQMLQYGRAKGFVSVASQAEEYARGRDIPTPDASDTQAAGTSLALENQKSERQATPATDIKPIVPSANATALGVVSTAQHPENVKALDDHISNLSAQLQQATAGGDKDAAKTITADIQTAHEQRQALVTEAKHAEALNAASDSIDKISTGDPKTDADTQDAARALVKIASGKTIDHLTTAEQAALNAPTPDGLPRVDTVGKTPVITQPTIERLRAVAPEAASYIESTHGNEQTRRATVLQPAQENSPSPTPTFQSQKTEEATATGGEAPKLPRELSQEEMRRGRLLSTHLIGHGATTELADRYARGYMASEGIKAYAGQRDDILAKFNADKEKAGGGAELLEKLKAEDEAHRQAKLHETLKVHVAENEMRNALINNGVRPDTANLFVQHFVANTPKLPPSPTSQASAVMDAFEEAGGNFSETGEQDETIHAANQPIHDRLTGKTNEQGTTEVSRQAETPTTESGDGTVEGGEKPNSAAGEASPEELGTQAESAEQVAQRSPALKALAKANVEFEDIDKRLGVTHREQVEELAGENWAGLQAIPGSQVLRFNLNRLATSFLAVAKLGGNPEAWMRDLSLEERIHLADIPNWIEQGHVFAKVPLDQKQAIRAILKANGAGDAQALAEFIRMIAQHMRGEIPTEFHFAKPEIIEGIRPLLDAPQMPEIVERVNAINEKLGGKFKKVEAQKASEAVEKKKSTVSKGDGGYSENPLVRFIRDDVGGIISKSTAQRQHADRYDKNKSLWDDAPTFTDPRHGQVYSRTGGVMPDEAAAAAANAGLLPEGADASTLWSALQKISDSHHAIAKSEREHRASQEAHEQQARSFERATSLQTKGEMPVTASDLNVGDEVKIGGETMKVTAIDPDTFAVTLKDGSKFGMQHIEDGKTIYVEDVEQKSLTATESANDPTTQENNTVPTLRQGENQGDLLSKQHEDLTLVGEKGVDYAHQQAERQKLEAARAEAQRLQDEQQAKLPLTVETPVDAIAHEAATSPINEKPEPTEAQKKAGNYEKAHVTISGLDISIENPEGSSRSGTDKGGKPWSRMMNSHYGYIKSTKGNDGDHLDVFIKPGTSDDFNGNVYVVNQKDPETGLFDEHKVILGATSRVDARQTYLAEYDNTGAARIDSIAQMPMDAFKGWANGKLKTPAQDFQPSKSAPVETPNTETPKPDTRSATQILNEAKRVKVEAPDGATMIRVTDSKGRKAVRPINEVDSTGLKGKKGDNIFKGGGEYSKIEAGTISGKDFKPMPGAVKISEDVPALNGTNPFDGTDDSPVVFKHEHAQRSSASETSPAMVGGAERSISRGIQAVADRASSAAGSSFTPGTLSRWAAETAAVGRWAREQGLIIPKPEIDRLPQVSNQTAEHVVHYDANTNRAVKVTPPGWYGVTAFRDGAKLSYFPASPADYARRWELFNKTFQDKVSVEGFTDGESKDALTKEPSFGMVISQPWCEPADRNNPSPEIGQINDYMGQLGFLPGKEGLQWYSPVDGVYVADARLDNFILKKDGVHPIDLVIDQLSQSDLQMLGLKTAQDFPLNGTNPAGEAEYYNFRDGENASDRIKKNFGLVDQLANRFRNIPGVDTDDVRSRGRIALVKAAQQYDPAKGEFAPYASRAIRNALSDLFNNQVRHVSHNLITLDEPNLDTGETNTANVPDASQNVSHEVMRGETRTILDSAINKLPAPLQKVVRGIEAGKTLERIGQDDLNGADKQKVFNLSKTATAALRLTLSGMGIRNPDDLMGNALNGTNPLSETGISEGDLVTDDFSGKSGIVSKVEGNKVSVRLDEGGNAVFKKDGLRVENPLNATNPKAAITALKKKLIPGLDAGKNIKEGIQSLLLPTAISPEHLRAAEVLGTKLGAMHHRQEASRVALKKDWLAFEKLGVHREGIAVKDNPGIKFMSDMSQGRTMSPELQPVANKITAMFNQRLEALKVAGAQLQTIRDNYFPGMWTSESRKAFNMAMGEAVKAGIIGEDFNVNTATEAQKAWVKDKVDKYLESGEGSDKDMLSYLAKRPMKGKESFRKQKVFDDIMDAAEFGLQPISHNPVDLVMGKLAEMDKSIMANEAFQEWKAKGLQKVINPTERPPDGWTKIDDKYGTIFGPPTVTIPEHVDKAVYEGLLSFAKSLGITHERSMRFPAGKGSQALGLSYQGQDLVRTKFATELSVLAHEIGHQLDHKYNLWNEITGGERGSERSAIQNDLRAIADLTGDRGGKVRSKEEKIAQMVEAYVHAPELMEKEAPVVFKKFDDFIHGKPELKGLADIKPGIELTKLTSEKYVGLPIIGYRIVTNPVGDIINNYLSSSLYNNRYFGTLYKGWMGTANALNQSQLGVGSAFHVGFTTGEAQVSAGANVLQDLYGLLRGNRTIRQVLKTAGNFPIATLETGMTGDKVLNAWRNPDGVIDERIAQVVRAVELAGGGFKLEAGLQTNQISQSISDFYNGHAIKAAMRSPVAFVELTAKPIMDYIVPCQKAGVFAHLAWRTIEQNPGKTLEELAPEFRQDWNRIDARLGQVRYDRLFLNNIAKNIVQGSVRAPGWTFGTIAELGGSFKDAYKFFEEFAKTGSLPKDLPPRVAYTISLLITVSAVNALLTYLFTGTKPEGMDYLAFRTKGMDEQGRPERFLIPSYMKDLLAYSKEPLTTLVNKSHPLISLFGDLIKNKDYYGVEIRDKDASAITQAEQTGKYMVKAFEPFWIRGARKEFDRKAGLLRMALPQIGVMPAPRKMTETAAEKMASEMNAARMPSAPVEQQQAERRIEKSKLVIEARKGNLQPMQDALRAGTITRNDALSIQQRATRTPLQNSINTLPIHQAARVWDVATPVERNDLRPVMLKKNKSAYDRGDIDQKTFIENQRKFAGPVTKPTSPVLQRKVSIPKQPAPNLRQVMWAQ